MRKFKFMFCLVLIAVVTLTLPNLSLGRFTDTLGYYDILWETERLMSPNRKCDAHPIS
jgi:hypothetical protein